MDRPPLIPLLHNTDPRSACESEQHMIDASQDVEKGSSACISLLQEYSKVAKGRQSREQSVKVKSCKRKLFDENSDKESMSKKILLLLPDHPTLTEYPKYRRRVKARPDYKSLSQSYEQALTKLQLAVSKRHRELKETESLSYTYSKMLRLPILIVCMFVCLLVTLESTEASWGGHVFNYRKRLNNYPRGLRAKTSLMHKRLRNQETAYYKDFNPWAPSAAR
uniref:Uncharacterized protein n=1 Tax=Magallana gigas TaxID=29159 RepID=A0A8W8NNB8_MAGGI